MMIETNARNTTFMAFIEGAGDFCDLTTYSIRGADIVTMDAENVLTGKGNPQIRKCALELIRSWDSLPKGPYLAVATNNTDELYVEELGSQLPSGIPVLSGIKYANKKTSPEMFLAAAEIFGVDPSSGVHIDDQYLSFKGAVKAHYLRGILVKPYGSTNHIGVKAGRVVDVSRRLASLSRQRLSGFVTDGIDG